MLLGSFSYFVHKDRGAMGWGGGGMGDGSHINTNLSTQYLLSTQSINYLEQLPDFQLVSSKVLSCLKYLFQKNFFLFVSEIANQVCQEQSHNNYFSHGKLFLHRSFFNDRTLQLFINFLIDISHRCEKTSHVSNTLFFFNFLNSNFDN